MDHFNDNIEMEKIAAELAQLPEITESNNWPHRNRIIYKLEKPGIWASICASALNLTDNEILKIWFLLEYANGKRRDNADWETLNLINATLEEADFRLGRNSSHVSYKRLKELWAYHSAHVYHLLGEFDKAVESHEFSYSIAKEKNTKSELLALYNLEYERLNAAIVKNENIKAAMNNFFVACNQFMSVLDKTDENDMRWMANTCYNLMLYSWLIERKIPGKVGISFLENLPPNIKPAFESQVLMLKSMCLIDKDPKKAIDAIGGLTTNDNEIHSLAMVVMAKAKLRLGMALNELEEIKVLKSKKGLPGMHLAAAIINNNLL